MISCLLTLSCLDLCPLPILGFCIEGRNPCHDFHTLPSSRRHPNFLEVPGINTSILPDHSSILPDRSTTAEPTPAMACKRALSSLRSLSAQASRLQTFPVVFSARPPYLRNPPELLPQRRWNSHPTHPSPASPVASATSSTSANTSSQPKQASPIKSWSYEDVRLSPLLHLVPGPPASPR